jgi:AcrR family transcriptional regulator
MNGYERRTAAKKQAIIAAARELFAQRGITEVGIGEIAAKARVSQVSIYNYFGDKDALAALVLASFVDEAMSEYGKILEKKIPFSNKLKIIMSKKHDMIVEVARSHFSARAWQDKAVQRVFREATAREAISLYVKFIELGKEEGAIEKRIPNEAVLAFFVSAMSIMQRPDYLQTSKEYKMGILKLVLHGVLGTKE